MSEHAVMPIADYKNACDTIRSKTGGTEVIKSGEMAAQISGVYDKGIEQGYAIGFSKGQLDAVQSAEALKGSLSGISVVSAKDVSPYRHNVECVIDRQNLCYQNGNIVNNAGVTATYDETTDTYTLNGTVTYQANVTLTSNIDIPAGTYHVYMRKVSGNVTVPSGNILIGVFDATNSNRYISNRSGITSSNAGNSAWGYKGTLPSTWSGKANLYLQCLAVGTVFDNLTVKFVISKYSSTYRPYVPDLSAVTLKVGASADDENAQTFTCNADGTVNGEITSIYPEMVISTDNIGVVVNAKYTKDIDAAFNALEQQILLLGGTV